MNKITQTTPRGLLPPLKDKTVLDVGSRLGAGMQICTNRVEVGDRHHLKNVINS